MGTIGIRVRKYRDDHDLTQEDLEAAWGIPRGHISLIESGQRTRLQPATLLRLARGLGVSIDELLSNPDGDSPPAT